MGSSEYEPARLILPYLQRADELQKHEPLVAYYCRLYAMERGLKIPQSDRTKTTNALLVSLMNQLEKKDKKSVRLGPDDRLHVEGFALNVFAKADKQDRAGRADLNTAKTFYAASIFFEILNQFGELQPDLEQKQKYAAWKAADIRKAVKEGRKPVPGPPREENNLSVPSSTSSGEYDLEPSKTDFPTRVDPAARAAFDSDSSTRLHNQDNLQHPTNISRQPSNVMLSPSSSISSTPCYPTDGFPPDNLHQPHSTNNSEHSNYQQSHHHLPYHPEPQQQLPQHDPSHDAPPSYSYPNFHSYPSFTESTLPAVPTHYPSYNQGSGSSYVNTTPISTTAYPSTAQYNSSLRKRSVSEVSPHATQASPHAAQKYEYDSSYQPPPEKIAEAHKAARFAVGALAFDDVSTAVDHLKKSLELLTKPSAEH